MSDIVFILLFGRLQPHRTPDSSDTPVPFWHSAAGSALIYLCIRIVTIIVHDSISKAIDSLPLILFQTICMFGCLLLYFKMLRATSNPKRRRFIYWGLGILSGIALTPLTEKLFYSGLNLNQDKATKPQTVQIVRQGEVTPYWFKVNPLYLANLFIMHSPTGK